jgi:hypothetical protein
MTGRRKVLLGMAALVAMAVPAFAIAQGAGDEPPDAQQVAELQAAFDAVSPAEAQAAFNELCDGDIKCPIVNGYADPEASGSGGRATLGQVLAVGGKPASDCPEAAAIYRGANLDVEVFTGPCPTAEEADGAVDAAGGDFTPAEPIVEPGSVGR